VRDPEGGTRILPHARYAVAFFGARALPRVGRAVAAPLRRARDQPSLPSRAEPACLPLAPVSLLRQTARDIICLTGLKKADILPLSYLPSREAFMLGGWHELELRRAATSSIKHWRGAGAACCAWAAKAYRSCYAGTEEGRRVYSAGVLYAAAGECFLPTGHIKH